MLCHIVQNIHQEINLKQKSIEKGSLMTMLYFLEKSCFSMNHVLSKLKLYRGLVKGNAVIGTTGFIVAGKIPIDRNEDKWYKYVKMTKKEHNLLKEQQKDEEIAQMITVSECIVTIVKQRLIDFKITQCDFEIWKINNVVDIEVKLNTAKGAGHILGMAIQNTITSVINFGIAGATMNPVIFVAAGYYVISTIVKCVGIAFKTHYQNNLIRNTLEINKIIFSQTIEPHQKRCKNLSSIYKINKFQKVSGICGNAVNTSLTVAASVYKLPISTTKPGTLSPILDLQEENILFQ
jgi:hypothetical protein